MQDLWCIDLFCVVFYSLLGGVEEHFAWGTTSSEVKAPHTQYYRWLISRYFNHKRLFNRQNLNIGGKSKRPILRFCDVI